MRTEAENRTGAGEAIRSAGEAPAVSTTSVPTRTPRRRLAVPWLTPRPFLLAAAMVLLITSNPVSGEPVPGGELRLLEPAFESFSGLPEKLSWRELVPQVRTVRIRSRRDGSLQPALYYDSGSDRAKPLLVVLHSWSFDYRQPVSIPFASWCVNNDWVFIHPDYRGVFNKPSATGSELAVQDVLDATDHALQHARIDRSRIYLVGFSGGAMTALLMAGRHPDRWSAVLAWAPIFDLVSWYRHVRRYPERAYARQIIASCGGVPRSGSAAGRSCQRRSPRAHLQGARGKPLRLHLAHGIEDDFAPASHAMRAFNQLARPEHRFDRQEIELVEASGKLPASLAGEPEDALFERAGGALLHRRSSENTTVSLFSGGHDVLYNAGLHWLSQQTRP